MNRRSFLYLTTAVVAGAGLAAAMWPFIDQMDPDAAVKAATEFPQYDLTGLRPRQLLTVRWHDIPVFVAVRTQAMLAAMQESAFVAQLVDPDSRESRQPAFAENFHRSSDPALAVLVGICPSCRCVPQYIAETSALGVVGGYDLLYFAGVRAFREIRDTFDDCFRVHCCFTSTRYIPARTGRWH